MFPSNETRGHDQGCGKAWQTAPGDDGLPQKNKLEIGTVSVEDVAAWLVD